ncbi:MAG: hypothetical protein IPJ00_09235 [Saprospirales bacterium]|nr:hypothetical protein [Saprospirales bacterium]
MGATDRTIRSIFLLQRHSALRVGGCSPALRLPWACAVHTALPEGTDLSIPRAFSSRPTRSVCEALDFVLIAITRIVDPGMLASLLPAFRAQRVPAIILEGVKG